MSRDPKLYVADVIESCDVILEFVTGHSFETFSADRRTVDAVARNLEVIGEAVKNIPQHLLDTQPHIPWKDIARFRDVIAHYYFRVNLQVVWRTVQDRLDELRSAAAKIYQSLPDDQ